MVSRVEVQYAVRVPDGRGGWIVLASRLSSRSPAESIARIRGQDAEVVAQVVMVAGDWTDPDTAEEVVRQHREHERRYEQVLISPLAWSREFETQLDEEEP